MDSDEVFDENNKDPGEGIDEDITAVGVTTKHLSLVYNLKEDKII
jgi:hypothetical protein